MTKLGVKLICYIVVCFAASAIHISSTKWMKDSERKKDNLSDCMFFVSFTIEIVFLIVTFWMGLNIITSLFE